jgi:nucleoid DNA-binding protein
LESISGSKREVQQGEFLMTKKDIVLKITDSTGIKQVDVKKIVQKTFDVIVDSLMQGEKVELRNFGVFKIKERRARLGRNPRTGQSVPVPPRKVVIFKSGLEMKQKVK